VLYIRLFVLKLPEDDLKKIETFGSISGFYVKMYFNTDICIDIL